MTLAPANDPRPGIPDDSRRLADEFRMAMEERQLTLHYQPIVHLETGVTAGFEALMRWTHPQRGPISPAVFIPVVEENGLIITASQWALAEACAALKRIEQRTGFDRALFMSVNFSSTDFSSEGFVDSLYTIISKSDVMPRCIHLELTESMLMANPENAKATLELCRKAGMSVAIDDFGTGYSSLSHLSAFPINSLKIDQSFVRKMYENERSQALIKSIVDLGKNMKMEVIAEGVETAQEAKDLRALGCDLAQGYYLARPMPELDVTKFVSSAEKFEL